MEVEDSLEVAAEAVADNIKDVATRPFKILRIDNYEHFKYEPFVIFSISRGCYSYDNYGTILQFCKN